MIQLVPGFKYIGPYYAGLTDSWHGASLHTTCPLGRDAPTRANPAGSTQDAEKFGFTKDREHFGRWLVSDHREHHPLLGVTDSAGAKSNSQELAGSNDVDVHIVNKYSVTKESDKSQQL
ncbi:hypothetical protein N7449_003126 [Penicillium cf. viridicatum]|uniref:Uncharacterized protein n=1 Tax=Penicillium cf. viridicatum TaxID=2972119 RepID=A0A9W9MWP2_9EURO|nr:hypothetical protein N7449_003126 [Penicillium cf. viridicatum]